MIENHFLYSVVLVVCNYLFRSSFGIETPPYNVIQHFVDFEIRFYPKITWLSLDFDGTRSDFTFYQSTVDGLQRFRAYVHGENEKHLKLDQVTAPVLTGLDTFMKLTGVKLYLGNGTNFPKPNPKLELIFTETTLLQCVAVRKFFHEADNLFNIGREVHGLRESLYKQGLKGSAIDYFVAQYNQTDLITTLNTASQRLNEVWIPTFNCN